MASLMLVNPRKRRKKAKAHKRRRNPITVTTRKRRKHTRKAKRRTYARNPISFSHVKRKSRRKYRRNPIGGKFNLKGLFSPVVPAAVSAVGAIGLDLAWGVIGSKLPASLSTGPVAYAAKGLGAIALGALAGMVVKKDTANQLAIGALTVVLHGAMKEGINKFAPNVQLGDIAEYMPSDPLDGLAEYVTDAGMSEYVTPGIGYAGGGTYMAQDDSISDMDGVGAVMPFSL